jgi:hypothetical protein
MQHQDLNTEAGMKSEQVLAVNLFDEWKFYNDYK